MLENNVNVDKVENDITKKLLELQREEVELQLNQKPVLR